MVSSNGIKRIAPDARNCYYDYEMDLVFYEKYTFINCRLECAILEAKKAIGCIPWHLPRVTFFKITNKRRKNCLRKTTHGPVTPGQQETLRSQ